MSNTEALLARIRVDSSDEEAIAALESAAGQGDRLAAAYLGMAWSEGLGVSRDETKAQQYFEIACRAGDAASCCMAATNLENGVGTIRNERLALERYRKAAELGDPFATLRLAEIYSAGELGEPPNKALATEYFEAAGRLKPTSG